MLVYILKKKVLNNVYKIIWYVELGYISEMTSYIYIINMGLTHYVYIYILLRASTIATIDINDILFCCCTGLLISNVMPL